MTREIATQAPGTFTVPRASAELRKLLDRREVVPDYGGEDGVSEGGGAHRAGRWSTPEWVDIRERDEAALRVHELRRGLEPASEAVVVDFLNFIWVATKHGADQSFDAVAMVYPRMLRKFGVVCWTDAMLDAAAARFKTFFPSVGEMVEFLEGEQNRLQDEIDRHEAIVKAPTGRKSDTAQPHRRPWAEGGAEDHAKFLRDKQDRERRELVEIMRKRDEENGEPVASTAIPPRAKSEDDKSYVARLTAFSRGQISLGARARKRDEERIRQAKAAEKSAALSAIRKSTPPSSAAKVKAAYDATGIKPRSFEQAESTDGGDRLGAMQGDYTTGTDP